MISSIEPSRPAPASSRRASRPPRRAPGPAGAGRPEAALPACSRSSRPRNTEKVHENGASSAARYWARRAVGIGVLQRRQPPAQTAMLAKHHHVDPTAQGTVQERVVMPTHDARRLPHHPQVQPQQRLALICSLRPAPPATTGTSRSRTPPSPPMRQSLRPGLVVDVTVEPRNGAPESNETTWLHRVKFQPQPGQCLGGLAQGRLSVCLVHCRDGHVVGIPDHPVPGRQRRPIDASRYRLLSNGSSTLP